MKPRGNIQLSWSPDFAYAIGLLTTDGSLSSDGRHIVFTSKDLELVEIFRAALNIHCIIGRCRNGSSPVKRYYRIQFGDVQFYRFLLKLGLMPNKSKIMQALLIPNEYFFDFLRGHFDGDGTFYSYNDPRWRSSYMFYTAFCSASRLHILWLQKKIETFLGVTGHITSGGRKICYQLKYAKADSLIVLSHMYHSPNVPCLSRKFLKIKKALTKVGKDL